MNLKTVFFLNSSSDQHLITTDHPESHERIKAIVKRITASPTVDHYMQVSPPVLSELSFFPDFILILAGFDGLCGDPLGDFSLSTAVFYDATQYIMKIADDSPCNGRIVSVLEGGYAIESTTVAVDKHMQALARYRAYRDTISRTIRT